MWKTLGDFFKTVGHLFVGVERTTRAAQPVIDDIAHALGAKGVGFLTVEHLVVSILGDVIDAAQQAEKQGLEKGILLSGTVLQDIAALVTLLRAHPEAPRG